MKKKLFIIAGMLFLVMFVFSACKEKSEVEKNQKEILPPVTENKLSDESDLKAPTEMRKMTVQTTGGQVNPEEKIRFDLCAPPRRVEKAQVVKLCRLKKERSCRKVEKSLQALREAAETQRNLMPSLIAAAEAEATLGEISAVLKEVFGVYEEATVV